MDIEQMRQRVAAGKMTLIEKKELLKKAGTALTEIYQALEGHLLHNDELDQKARKELLASLKTAGDEVDVVITALAIEKQGV